MLNILTSNPFSFFFDPFNLFRDWSAYWADATKKTNVLVAEQQKQSDHALKITGITNEEYMASHPFAEDFDIEVLVHGKELPRPIGYVLLKISTKPGYEFDPKIVAAVKDQKKIDTPFVLMGPRAGKNSRVLVLNSISQLSVALATRNHVYVIDYLPWPDKSQTLDSVCDGVATFLEKICALHPEAKNGPDVVPDCQAGWMFHLVLQRHGERFRSNTDMPIGSPKTFLAGDSSKKKNRGILRFLGLSGKRLSRFLADIDGGYINGFWLTANFEDLDSASTQSGRLSTWEEALEEEFVKKNTNFRRWWDSGVYYTIAEFSQILELFVEDKFREGTFELDGVRLEPKKGRATRIIICSEGDSVVSPSQVFTKILKDFNSLEEFKKTGQVRCVFLDKDVGHLGIFLSSKFILKVHLPIYNATRRASELPPGVYEIEISNGEVTFHERDFGFIESIVKDSDRDRECITKVATINGPIDQFYSVFLSPLIQFGNSFVPREVLSWSNPVTFKHLMLSGQNPGMKFLSDYLRKVIPFLPQESVKETNVFKEWEATFFKILRDTYEKAEYIKGSAIVNTFKNLAAS